MKKTRMNPPTALRFWLFGRNAKKAGRPESACLYSPNSREARFWLAGHRGERPRSLFAPAANMKL